MMKYLTIPVLVVTSMTIFTSSSRAADPSPINLSQPSSAASVTAWVSEQPFAGDTSCFTHDSWKQLPTADPAAVAQADTVTGHVTLEAPTAIVAITPDGSALTFWTRHKDTFIRRGEVALEGAASTAHFKLTASKSLPGPAVEVAAPDHKLRHTIVLTSDGLLRIDQQPGQSVSVASPMRYLLAPSLVGTDFLYTPQDLAECNPCYVVSMNVAVGLLADYNGMLVAVWPPGKQLARIGSSSADSPQTIDTFTLDTAGESFYLAYLEQPGIWHEEALKSEYLEQDTKISWKRPLEARWVGRFHIDSDDYSFPFYFQYERLRLWGRYIRGWFYYPVWFDFTDTMIHFEKKFPPQGELLIYYLDTFRGGSDFVSPLGVMRNALGTDQATKLLDMDGTQERLLLPHGNAVCAMTREIELYFAAGPNAPPQALVESYADDVASFIRMIRERVFEYQRFASETLRFIETNKESHPALAESTEALEEILAEMLDIAHDDLPKVSLEEVNKWTRDMRTSAPTIEEGDLLRVKELAQRCRAVAGTQDDMARDLSVLAVRAMEEAARIGKASPDHAHFAEQLIAKTRAVFRKPTWWEVCRRYGPRSDPGAQ